MTSLVFVHGWGFTPDFWRPLAYKLPDYDHKFVDLGFTGDIQPIEDESAFYITHSMGLAWVTEHVTHCGGVVAINGFTKFCADDDWPEGMAPRLLARMIRQFDRDPAGVWCEFMKNCGMEDPVYPEGLNAKALGEGLRYLKTCDVREGFVALDCPKLAISAGRDQIVSEKMSAASFGEGVIWYKDANHLLPLFEPQALADDIRRFLDQSAT